VTLLKVDEILRDSFEARQLWTETFKAVSCL
jgi:hypothetical protein